MIFLPQSSRKPPGPIRPLPPALSGPRAGPGSPWRYLSLKSTRCASLGKRRPSVGAATRVGDRLDQIGGDDDDEVGLAALKAVRAEQRAEDRNIADPRDLGDELLGGVLQQAGERKAFAAAELDRGFGACGRVRGGDRDDLACW